MKELILFRKGEMYLGRNEDHMALRFYFNLRLRYYVDRTRDQLIRYQHIIVFLLLLLIPSFESLSLLSLSLHPIVDSSYKLESLSLSIIGYIFFGILWIHLQQNAVRGGVYRDYFHTLPLPKRSLIISELAIILIANILPFLPIYIEIGEILNRPTPSIVKFVALLKLFVFVAVIVLMQWLYLNVAIKNKIIALTNRACLPLKFALPSYLLPQLAIIKANKLAFTTRWLAACTLVICSLLSKSLIMIIIMFSMQTLILSGLFSILYCSHQTYRYCLNFANFKIITYYYDYLLIFFISLASFMMFFYTCGYKQHIAKIWLTQIPLLALLQIVQTRLPRWGAFVSLMLTFIYMGGLLTYMNLLEK